MLQVYRLGETFEANYEGINRCNQALNIVPQEANPALRRLIVRLSFKSFYVFYLVKHTAEFLLLIIYQTLLLMRIGLCN
jgi:hypothetical protein